MTPAPNLTEADLLHLLQQSQEHAIVLLDQAGHIASWNNAAERTFGYSQDEARGKHISFIFTEFDNAMGAPLHELLVASSVGSAEDDRWHVRKDGAKIWVSGAVTPLKDAAGRLRGFGKVMRDRTDAKTLTSTFENRIGQLLEERQRMQDYFAGLAHEIRNSLAPVKNALAIVSMGQPERREQALDIARRQIEVLTRLAADAADLATIHAGKLALSLEPLELGEWLPHVAETLNAMAAVKGQTVELLLVPGPVRIAADPQRLHQVVFNLLHNAIKYTQAGGRIWLKLTVEDRSAVIRFEDNGQGIDGPLLPKIFDLFTQASVIGSEGGLGVGLSLVRDLVRAHGGSVEVRSEGLGMGSEFTVRLPLERHQQEATKVGGQ